MKSTTAVYYCHLSPVIRLTMAKKSKPKFPFWKDAKNAFEWLLLILMFIHYVLEIVRKG
jgi:hypothetical protein